MEKFLSILFLAIIVEGIVTYVTTIYTQHRMHWESVVACVIGIVVSITYSIDLFELVGMTSHVPFVGMVLTGILISRGSNYMFDLIGRFTNAKTNLAD